VDDIATGRRFRALRQRLGWRQADLGARAGLAQDTVSRIERGRFDGIPVRRLRAVAHALDAQVVISIRWRGGDLDRLVDEGHAVIVGRVASLLDARGWEIRPEVTFAVYGERGSIDVLAWHPPTRTLIVVEVKTELTSVEETLRRHDVKARLAAAIAAERFGWRPAHIARLLVLPDTSTARRRVERHTSVLVRAYPHRGSVVRNWLRDPSTPIASSPIAGLVFVTPTRSGRTARKRIRARPLSGRR
jgi:transcriptional regulator with XRE-family HTH domain